MKSAGSARPGFISSLRSASQASRACSAGRPTGTLRRLLPLPSTWAVASLASTQPRAVLLAWVSRPSSSPTRRPQEDRTFKRSFPLPMAPRTRPSLHVCLSLKVAQDC
jgi:hypothetical protein